MRPCLQTSPHQSSAGPPATRWTSQNRGPRGRRCLARRRQGRTLVQTDSAWSPHRASAGEGADAGRRDGRGSQGGRVGCGVLYRMCTVKGQGHGTLLRPHARPAYQLTRSCQSLKPPGRSRFEALHPSLRAVNRCPYSVLLPSAPTVAQWPSPLHVHRDGLLRIKLL